MFHGRRTCDGPCFITNWRCIRLEKELYFAGGCFWGVEKYFLLVNGVIQTEVGYANGNTEQPTYEDVCVGDTCHAETVRVIYDPARAGMAALVRLFFDVIDPTALNRQGDDVGTQYRSGIYYTDAADLPVIEAELAAIRAKYAAPIAVEVLPLSRFYSAETYHQRYLEKNPEGYCHIGQALFEHAARANGANEALLRVVKLRTDYGENPVGFDFSGPSLSWIVEAEGRNKTQTAYRLQVAGVDGFVKPLLDTGRVETDQSLDVQPQIKLEPMTRYEWRVMVWDEDDKASPYSEVAFFETGRYAKPWDAEWIGANIERPLLRKSFRIKKPVASAKLYACGVGLYRARINGKDVTDEQLTPNFNAYDHWLQYQTYDVTDILVESENAIGAMLGDGYYKGRVNWPAMPERRNIYGDECGFIAELYLHYADGSSECILTDASWKAHESPFLRAEIYDGEVYDARKRLSGWDAPGYDEGEWTAVKRISIDKRLLHARLSPPVVINERIKPVALIVSPLGEQILDFGQNMAGWVRFQCDAPAGTEVRLQFGEMLYPDNTFYRDNYRTALSENVYISDGVLREYAPTFTFFGFRYAKVTGLATINSEDFTAEVVHTQMERTGYFECSDERVNRLFLNALWGQKGNFVDVPTDCPQRDERMGWTGDAQVFAATALMNMESAGFYRKYLHDLAYEQRDAGFVPVVIPNILKFTDQWTTPTTGWGDASTIIPWNVYLYYGDVEILRVQYDSMKAWVEYMRAQDTKGVDRYYGFHIGDWLALDRNDPDEVFGLTPTELLATSYYAHSTDILAKTARILGKEDDAERYEALARRIRESFRHEFVTPGGRVAAETQTADLIALQMEMLAQKDRTTVAKHLTERLNQDKQYLTTGFLGTPLLCPVLSENGYNEYAYKLLMNNRCPSWLYEVEQGATTIWERWNSLRPDGSFGPVSMNSFNHYALGAVVEWLYRYVCGLNPVENAPGFKRSLVRPMPNSLLGHAKASIRTQYGTLGCGWALSDGAIAVDVTVPFNTEAEIHLPDAVGAEVLENGVPVQGICFVRGSGTWHYAYQPNMDTIDRRVPTV